MSFIDDVAEMQKKWNPPSLKKPVTYTNFSIQAFSSADVLTNAINSLRELPEIEDFYTVILHGKKTLIGVCKEQSDSSISVRCRRGSKMEEVFYVDRDLPLTKATAEELFELEGLKTHRCNTMQDYSDLQASVSLYLNKVPLSFNQWISGV